MNPSYLEKTLRLLLLVFISSFATSAFALFLPGQGKAVKVRANTSILSVDVQPIKNSFWVDEKIRLRSKGNKPYYLYLFNVDHRTGKAIMILPNKIQTNNYYGHQGYIVPNREIEFYSDRPGSEQMIMVASTDRLNVDLEGYASAGNFVTGNSADFEKSIGIRFTDPAKHDNPNLVVKTFEIAIQGERQVPDQSFFSRLFNSTTAPEAPNYNEPVAFISSANNEYIDGEKFKLVFGANQKGFVHLYSIDPHGAYDLIKIVPVDGKNISSLTVQAAPPYGLHTLVALFDYQDVINHQTIANINLNSDKSLYVVDQTKRAIAIHPVIIKPYSAH